LWFLQREDLSFQLTTHPDTGQLLLSGMGELHLEIIKDRILNHFEVPAEMGCVQISYCTTASQRAKTTVMKGNPGASTQVKISLNIEPSVLGKGNKWLDQLSPTMAKALGKPAGKIRNLLAEGAEKAFKAGVKFRFLLEDVTAILVDLVVTGGEVSDTILRAAVLEAMKEGVLMAVPQLLEPIMKLEVSTDEKYVSTILTDLQTHRRGELLNVSKIGGDFGKGIKHILIAEVPLKELVGYSTSFRSLTRGSGTFMMEFARYGHISDVEMAKVVQSLGVKSLF